MQGAKGTCEKVICKVSFIFKPIRTAMTVPLFVNYINDSLKANVTLKSHFVQGLYKLVNDMPASCPDAFSSMLRALFLKQSSSFVDDSAPTDLSNPISHAYLVNRYLA